MVAECDRVGAVRRVHRIAAALGVALGLAGCSGKTDAGVPTGEARPAERPAPKACPAGNALAGSACIAVVAPQVIAAVARQHSRLDDLARLLDQVDTVRAPIDLFGGLRQQGWASPEKLAALDAIAGELDQAVQALRAFAASLGEASARLGNLKGELDRVMADTGPARRIEEVRAQIVPELRAVVEPFAAQVEDAIQRAIAPLTAKLPELGGAVIAGCTMARLSGRGEKMKELCAQVRDVFGKAVAYMADLEGRPAKLFDEVTSELLAELDPLVDAGTRKLLGAARARVDEARKPPPGGARSGSVGSGKSR
jgi:hypothetical protein